MIEEAQFQNVGRSTLVIIVTYTEAVDQWTLCSDPRKTHIISRNSNIILHKSWYGLEWLEKDRSDCIPWMVQLISTLFWICCKTNSFRNWKTLVNTKVYALVLWRGIGTLLTPVRECWIGRGSPLQPPPFYWPYRRPGLSPYDYSLCGYLKDTVAQQRYQAAKDFNIWIKRVTPQMLRKTSHRTFFSLSSVISNQSTWVLYELMCWLSLVVWSPPARSLSWIHSTVDWCMASRKWGFDLKSNSTNYSDHGHHGDPTPTRKIPMVEPGIEPGTS